MEKLMARTVTTETTETTQIIETDTAWLQALEERVHAAAGRIRELRDENAALRGRLQEMEERLATVPSSEEASRWVEERQEIRGRVTRLVEHLEELMVE
jgi:predicted nuclease with TOPRIM domain